MCLARPVRVRSVVDTSTAEVTDGGRTRPVVLLTLDAGPPVRPGDWLLVQSGLAVRRLSDREAADRRRLIDNVIGGDDEP
jgi:hydrogenase assembly chaperone HypC/HupF